jgi:hypothetical protein
MPRTYPLGDTPTIAETGEASFNTRYNGTFRVVSTGEKRPPRKGEWYLSGAIITGYRAPNDLSAQFHIARLVRVKTETITLETIY